MLTSSWFTPWQLATLLAVPVALLADALWGEPPVWAHPVVAMGRFLGLFGERLTLLGPSAAFLGGAMVWWLGICLVAAMALSCEVLIGLWMPFAPQLMKASDGVPLHALDTGLITTGLLQGLALGLVLKPMLAWRMLRDEVAGVEAALSLSLDEGRGRLQRLVSRDVAQLDEAAVRESAIESLAENLNDAVVAPLFWFAIGGLPLAAAYRFANTADAMWGYRGRYEWAGKWAARADDLLSWVPARLTALLLCLAAMRWPTWQAMLAQARMTPSPNGGWPMGTMALLLGKRLGKPGVYALNGGTPSPSAADTAKALRWAGMAVRWGAACCMLSMAAIVWMR